MTWNVPRWRLIAALIALGWTPTASAQSLDISVRYAVAAPRAAFGHEQSAQPRDDLLIQPLFADRAVKLEDEAKVHAGWGRKRLIPAGTPLFAAFTAEANLAAVYCASATAKGRDMWGLFFPCFYDTDLDGAFDHVATAIEGGPLVGVVDDGTVASFGLSGKQKPLPAPLRYTELSADQGPEAAIRFRWRPVRPLNGKGPMKISIWTILGRWAVSDPVTVPLNPDGTATLEVEGAIFTILRLSPNDTLHFKVDRPIPEHSAPVNVGAPPTTIYIYM